MASLRGKRRRSSPINYKLLHEIGKRKKVQQCATSDSSSESSSDDSSSEYEFEGVGRPSTGVRRSPLQRDDKMNETADDSESDSSSESDESSDNIHSQKFDNDFMQNYMFSSDSESESHDDTYDEGLPRFEKPRRNNSFNPAELYNTHFSDTDDNDSADDLKGFVSDWMNSNDYPKSDENGNFNKRKGAGPGIDEFTSSKTNKLTTAVGVPCKPVRKMAADLNSSAHWREQGNQIYITAHENLSPLIRRDRLRQATNFYYKAFNFSKTEEEKVSAAKNLGMAAWRMAKVVERAQERLSVLVYFYKEAFKYLSLAWRDSAEEIKSQTWRDGIMASAKACWEDMKTGRIDEMPVDDRKVTYHDVVQSIQIASIKADIYIHQASCHFHSGINAIQQGDYRKGLYEMKECFLPINEAKNCGKGSLQVEAEARILEEDVFMHSCMAESIQAREIGDGIFRKVTLDEENLNMDMVYDMIDWYKQAILRTREVTEVELEAIALSRMGRVYDIILKLKYKAKEYLMRSIQLAHSMHPRTFHGEVWFKECSEILERYQQETIHEEEAKWQKEREGLLKELEKEMNEIEKQDMKSGEEFLKFIYRVHPPKNSAHKLVGVPRRKDARLESPVLKKILQKAIVHYHPDRVNSDKHGKTWKVLAEEITKCLTRRYECLKG